jgi:hypothetical protein
MAYRDCGICGFEAALGGGSVSEGFGVGVGVGSGVGVGVGSPELPLSGVTGSTGVGDDDDSEEQADMQSIDKHAAREIKIFAFISGVSCYK